MSTSPATRYANPHAVTSILKTDGTTKNFSYDANGNVKSDGTLTLAWDYKNRLVSSRVGITTTTYAYNPGDARVSKTTGTTTTYYPSHDYSVKGTTSTVYVSGASGLTASIENTNTTSTVDTIHTDHLGSTSVVTDEDGVMIELLDYNPYGTLRLRSGSSTDTQKTYIGEYSDDETGLSYLNARYYDPGRGGFLSQDPVYLSLGSGTDKREQVALLDPQSQNSYLYARGNPINALDKNGEFWETIFDLVSIALSVYDYQHIQSFATGLFLGLDILGGLAPGVPSAVGYVRHGAQVAQITKYFGDVAGYTGKASDVARAAGLFAKNVGFKFTGRSWSAGSAGNDVASLVGHFVKHGDEVGIGATSVGDYYNKANGFLDSGNYKSWADDTGGMTYYNKGTGQVGYTDKNGNLQSYYQVDRSNPDSSKTIEKLDSNYDQH